MTNYKIGDKVRIVNDFETWSEGEFPESSILTVVKTNRHSEYTIDRKNLTVEIEALEDYPEDFEPVVNAPFGGFVSASTTGLIGESGNETVMPITLEQSVRAEPARFGISYGGAVVDLPKEVERTLLQGYKDALTKSHEERDPEVLGVYRPNLEDRKVGKVRVELVDDGFPLALREIAKVMTWAQTAKGYKDHDWQNLPNPEQGLAGATSRHRTDHIIQRQVGKSAAIECTDHESEILHKAHEAFGVLAQLELILRGVIK